jgi:3-dehydroquinate dehydratase-2
MNILILNGPNLNLLGEREPEIYGNQSFEDYLLDLKSMFPKVEIEYFQSNVEGELINKLHENRNKIEGIIFNAGGYTHTSVAIADAVAAISTPVVEVHISNVHARNEQIRHTSLMAKNCVGVISGFGLQGYEFALRSFLEK